MVSHSLLLGGILRLYSRDGDFVFVYEYKACWHKWPAWLPPAPPITHCTTYHSVHSAPGWHNLPLPTCGSSPAARAPPSCLPGHSGKGLGEWFFLLCHGVAGQAWRQGCGNQATAPIGVQWDDASHACHVPCVNWSSVFWRMGGSWASHLCQQASYLYTNMKPPSLLYSFPRWHRLALLLRTKVKNQILDLWFHSQVPNSLNYPDSWGL